MIASNPTTLLSLFLYLLTSTSSARPSLRYPSPHQIRAPSSNLSAYTPVLTDGSQSLPSPTGTLTYIALGRGTQNYTCASSSSSSTPTPNGATATLFDATALLPSFPSRALAQSYLDTLPAAKVDNSIDQIKDSGLPVLGTHFFTAENVPAWTLDDGGVILYGSGVADIPPPGDADKGPEGTGAVDWKVLARKERSVGGLQGVYRVETAGGAAPGGCEGVEGGEVLVEYAAMYWFYS